MNYYVLIAYLVLQNIFWKMNKPSVNINIGIEPLYQLHSCST